MYQRILVAVENSPADRTILAHVGELARITGAELLLVHVADGFAARNFDQLKLRESEEMRTDREYLDTLQRQLTERGLPVQTKLATGDPHKMGQFASPGWVKALAWSVAVIIAALNVWLLYQTAVTYL